MKWESTNAGLEDGDVFGLNRQILIDRHILSFEDIVQKYKKEILELEAKNEWVKDPQFTKTLKVWVAAGANIEKIIISVRDLSEVVQSIQKNGAAVFDIRGQIESFEWNHFNRVDVIERFSILMSTLKGTTIPYIYVFYPEDYLSEQLGELAGFLEINYQKLKEIVKKKWKKS